MKHFFFPYQFPYEKQDYKGSVLEFLIEKYIGLERIDGVRTAVWNKDITSDETLKAYYDMADIIHDKRFEQEDQELKEILGVNSAPALKDGKPANKKQQRISALKRLLGYIEEQYKKFEEGGGKQTEKRSGSAERQEEEKTGRGMRRVLYHLVRGNFCLRISQCYYEDFDLSDSEVWTNRAIEIFWHGKNLATVLRDEAIAAKDREKERQADLYLRLIKLNLAKHYRDYARQNRRSDFDAALDEFKQVTRRVEEECKNCDSREQKRQYAIIWMDAVINIAKIQRRKYQVNAAEHELREIYSYMESRLAGADCGGGRSNNAFAELRKKAANILNGNWKEENTAVRQKAEAQFFEKYDDLELYDQRRYFLLVLLELARICRDRHFKENYLNAIALAVTADQWSCEMDKREGYIPGHNIDAFITISSSLRKYIKFEVSAKYDDEPLNGIVHIGKMEYEIKLRRSGRETEKNLAGLSDFIEKLQEFAQNGNLKAKAEVIKWHCMYLERPGLLGAIKSKVGDYESIKKSNYMEEEASNIQLCFLEGLVLMRSGKYEEAIKIFHDLLDRNQKEMQYIRLGTIGLKARYLLANCYMSRAEFFKAEKILKHLRDTLAFAKKGRKMQRVNGSTDADVDARIEIDLGYCYMQRGAYEEAIRIYEDLFVRQETTDVNRLFALPQIKEQRQIMGLNNYAACCIFTVNNAKNRIETAREIFLFMETFFGGKEVAGYTARYETDPETNLLKGYYTLCMGIEPDGNPVTDEQLELCRHITKPEYSDCRDRALLLAYPYFRKACRFEDAFAAQYDLLDEEDKGNKAQYRNEVERISAYVICLTKLYRLYQSNYAYMEKLSRKQNGAGAAENEEVQLSNGMKMTRRQWGYLETSRQNLERFLLHFPTNYKISLKAAIALAEWLLEYKNEENNSGKENLEKQMYRSFCYVTIYEERGAQAFNNLKNNRNFRFFNAVQRGKFYALLLAMYKPIKTVKEECCFNMKDKENTPHLVHYTSLETLKKILAEKPENLGFRINNCGYMNDVFEGNIFLRHIGQIADKGNCRENGEVSGYVPFVEKYFPQINRSDEDMLPSGSNVYIGSLSVKEDSFPMWSGYADNESGCNIEFGEGFFDINGIPYYPRALRDYMLSKYTDKDYPLYIVQYINAEFEKEYAKYDGSGKGKKGVSAEENFETFDVRGYRQHCGTEAICYSDLFRLFRQIALRWKQLDGYLENVSGDNGAGDSIKVIRAFAADRINEIRFLFKNVDYEYEGEVRVVYTDSENEDKDKSAALIDSGIRVPRVYVNLKRELENLTIRLGSRIEDATVDKYVTWLKHTKKVQKVRLARQNRYTT